MCDLGSGIEALSCLSSCRRFERKWRLCGTLDEMRGDTTGTGLFDRALILFLGVVMVGVGVVAIVVG